MNNRKNLNSKYFYKSMYNTVQNKRQEVVNKKHSFKVNEVYTTLQEFFKRFFARKQRK